MNTKERRSGFRIMRKLIVLVKPLTPIMCFGILLGVIGYLCAIFLTVIAVTGVTEGLKGLNGMAVSVSWRQLFLWLLIFAFARGFFHYGEQYCNHYIAFRLLAIIRHKVFAALRRLCPAKLEGKDKGDLISLLTSDIELLEVFYAHTISPIVIAVIVSLIMVLFIGSRYMPAGMIALAAYLCVGVLIPLTAGKKGSRHGMTYRHAFGDLSSFVLESLYGVDETIQYGMGKKTSEMLDSRSYALSRMQKTLNHLDSTRASLTNLAIQFFSWSVLLLSVWACVQGTISFLQCVQAVAAMISSFGPVSALASLSGNLNQTLASGERVLSLLEEQPQVEEITEKAGICFQGAKADHIHFGYDQEPVLQDFSIRFSEDTIIGIHGASGSGKSTLLKLFMRFWDVQKGSISISHRDVREINTADLRNMEGCVSQDTWLFHDTIARNIALAKPGAAMTDIEDAARKAGIHEFIMSLPAKYETKVAELGDTLSDGEKQRIGLARAFLHDADLILLDEPTSNLDALNEGVILKSLKEAAKGRTIVLVSHRLSTTGIADRVYTMESGRLS